MANILLHEGLNGISYSTVFSVLDGDVSFTEISGTTLAGYAGQAYFSFGGSFSIVAGGLSGGTIRSFYIQYSATPIITVTGLSLDVIEVAWATGPEIERMMLADADVLTSHLAQGDIFNMYGGDDWLRLGNGNDVIDGGAGVDTFSLDAGFASARFALQSGGRLNVTTVQGRDTVANIEILEFNDTSVGLAIGGTGADSLTGDKVAGILRDLMFGDRGNDTLRGGQGDDRLFGQSGGDTLFGQLNKDLLAGGGGADSLDGGFGNDRLRGGGGNDLLVGGRHDDSLSGDAGRDRLTGGADDDSLTGGRGRDVFVFGRRDGRDTITDFELGLDRIEITAGANGLGDLTFTRVNRNTLITFGETEIFMQDTLPAQLKDAAHFLF